MVSESSYFHKTLGKFLHLQEFINFLKHNRFMALFPGLPGWAGARRIFLWTLWCKGRYLRQTHRQSTGHHSIWANQRPTSHVPYMSTDFGRRAFSYSSPATWNSIPISIKRHLKSYFITQLTNNWCTPSGHLATARASDSCFMLDYMCVL